MKEIKTKPLVKIADTILTKAPKAALHKANETVKNAAEQKTAKLLSTNSQDHSAAANSADSMVEGGHVVAEKTAHVAVFTVKTTVNIGSKIADAKATSKKIKDITVETHNLSADAYVPDKGANPMSIKTREIQIENVKSREQPIIKTASQEIKTREVSALSAQGSDDSSPSPKLKNATLRPASEPLLSSGNTREVQPQSTIKSREQPIIKTVPQQTNAHRVHTSNVKNRAMPKKPLASQYTINAALPEKGGSLQKQRMQQIKARTAAKTKIAPRSVKTSNTKIRKVGTEEKKAKQTKAALKLAQKTAQQAVHVAKITAEKAAQTVKVIAKAVMSAIKACIAAMQSMFAALVAVGGTAFAVILIVCLVALLAGSVLGIFFAAEPTGHGIPIQDAMSTLNEEYYKQIKVIQEKVPHDHVEIKSSDGVMGIRWEDVLAIYSAKITGADTPTEVVTIDDAKLNMIRTILVDMNSVAYKMRVDSKEITVPVYDADGQLTYDKSGEIITEIQVITETTLIIELQHKTPAQMASEYGFTAKQYSALALLEETQYATLWAQLLGGLTMNGSGEIISPDTDWKGTDIFAWPLPKSFSITSRFGYRKDSFTGKISYHSGTDIAAPYGTPILAAASGTVTVANATDPWGFSYGYHIKLDNGNGKETLYAHCSSICVTPGQTVQQGEVIGFVGSTGNSTGNHLHFEVQLGGEAVDGLDFFKLSAQC